MARFTRPQAANAQLVIPAANVRPASADLPTPTNLITAGPYGTVYSTMYPAGDGQAGYYPAYSVTSPVPAGKGRA